MNKLYAYVPCAPSFPLAGRGLHKILARQDDTDAKMTVILDGAVRTLERLQGRMDGRMEGANGGGS